MATPPHCVVTGRRMGDLGYVICLDWHSHTDGVADGVERQGSPSDTTSSPAPLHLVGPSPTPRPACTTGCELYHNRMVGGQDLVSPGEQGTPSRFNPALSFGTPPRSTYLRLGSLHHHSGALDTCVCEYPIRPRSKSCKNQGPVLALDWGDGHTHGMGPGTQPSFRALVSNDHG